VRTKREVDDRVLAGISETHESKEDEGRTVEVIDAGDGVSLKTPRRRQWETTSLFSQVTDDGRHKENMEHIGGLDLLEGRELK